MIYKKENIEYLFNNLKNGDFFGFYHHPWYFLFSQFINLITGNKLDHIACVFDVKKTQDLVRFKLGEQLISKGKTITEYSITRDKEGEFNIDSRFTKKYIDFYLLSNSWKITIADNNRLKKYWKTKEDYNLDELAFTVNWFYKLFGNKNKIYDNNCSTAARQSMIEIGIEPTKFDDKVPNPTEFTKFSYIELITKVLPNEK